MTIRSFVIAFAFLFLTTSHAATFQNTSKKFDSGVNSSVAKQDDTIVVVYSSGYFNTLWYRVGLINDKGIEWGKSYRYADGLNASIVMSGSTLVEVHKSKRNDSLWYQVGTLDKNSKTIEWGEPKKYDEGQHASLAISENKLIEAHQLTEAHLDYCYNDCQTRCDPTLGCWEDCEERCIYSFTHKLFYRTGLINNLYKTIYWTNAQQYAEGQHPSLAASGNTIVETHQAADSSKLWSQVGTLQADTIDWIWTQNYDKGDSPSLCLSGDLLVTMHRKTYNRLSYHIGKLDFANRSIQWSPAQSYESGILPSLALDKDSLIEVHTSAFFKYLYFNTGLVDPNTGTIKKQGFLDQNPDVN